MPLDCVRLLLARLGHLATCNGLKSMRAICRLADKVCQYTQDNRYEHLPADLHMPTYQYMTGSVTRNAQSASVWTGTTVALVPNHNAKLESLQ